MEKDKQILSYCFISCRCLCNKKLKNWESSSDVSYNTVSREKCATKENHVAKTEEAGIAFHMYLQLEKSMKQKKIRRKTAQSCVEAKI